ncbi:MAG: hypothetical protein F6K30_13025 [Cyanothece sp. SIO2G6]|nr:hypothetical protein [Cyanothece sp. SIO2G6]
MSSSRNLWGDIPVAENLLNSPRRLLQEQADILTAETKGKLVGELSSTFPNGKNFSVMLRIKVPSLQNYIFGVLKIEYPIDLYPLKIVNHTLNELVSVTCNNDKEYEHELGTILRSDRVKQVISALLSEVIENVESEE